MNKCASTTRSIKRRKGIQLPLLCLFIIWNNLLAQAERGVKNLKPAPLRRTAVEMNPAGRGQHEDWGIMQLCYSFSGGEDEPYASLKEKNDNPEGPNCNFLLASNWIPTPKSTLHVRQGALLYWE